MRMKRFSPNRKPVSYAASRNAAFINQLVTPGLGSLMSKRWVAGIGQLILATVGCGMLVVWFFKVMLQYYGQITGDVKPHAVGWIGEWGGIFFIASWLWALATSISLMREAKMEEPKSNENVPPKL